MRYIHGMNNTPTYSSWRAMKTRCTNKKHVKYPNYGGRGITVCAEWHNFASFFNDMGVRPEGYELDRIDTEKGYYKDNCRWVDKATNLRNRRNTRCANINGEVLTLKEISERYDIPYARLNTRWHVGDRDEELIRPFAMGLKEKRPLGENNT